MFWSYLHPPVPPISILFSLPTQLTIPSYPLLLKFTKSKLCCQNILGSVAFSWNMVSLLGPALLEKSTFPLPRFCARCFNHWVHMCSRSAMSRNSVCFTYLSPLFLPCFLSHLPQCQPNLGRRREISIYIHFRAENSVLSYSFSVPWLVGSVFWSPSPNN